MTQRLIRWAVVPVLLFALTGCTQLTNADGFTPTPVPTTAPTPSDSGWQETSVENLFGIPEETAEAFTKESLPDPAGLAPEGIANAVSLGDLDATKTKRSLRLPKPVESGTLTVQFVCVDGEIYIGSDELGGMGIPCDGVSQAFAFSIDEATRSLKIDLTVSRGTSYSAAAYQEPDARTIID